MYAAEICRIPRTTQTHPVTCRSEYSRVLSSKYSFLMRAPSPWIAWKNPVSVNSTAVKLTMPGSFFLLVDMPHPSWPGRVRLYHDAKDASVLTCDLSVTYSRTRDRRRPRVQGPGGPHAALPARPALRARRPDAHGARGRA